MKGINTKHHKITQIPREEFDITLDLKEQEVLSELEASGFSVSHQTYFLSEQIFNTGRFVAKNPRERQFSIDGAKNHPYNIKTLSIFYPNDDPYRVHPLGRMPEKFFDGLEKLKYVRALTLNYMPYMKFPSLPLSLENLSLTHCRFSSFHDIDAPWQSIRKLYMHDCPNVLSLEGLPSTLPLIEEIEFDLCGFLTIENPPKMPNLSKISIKNCPIRNFLGVQEIIEYSPLIRNRLPSWQIARAWENILNRSPEHIISHCGIPLSIFYDAPDIGYYHIKQTLQYSPTDIPSSYLPFIDRSHFSEEEIWGHFRTNPTSLADRYGRGELLSHFEMDRILYEGTPTTFRVLYRHKGEHDSLVKKLVFKWKMNVRMDSVLK
jgi:hypothetical protein